MRVMTKSDRWSHTCVLHVVNAHCDKVGHWRVLALAQAGQTAAEHLICGIQINTSYWLSSIQSIKKTPAGGENPHVGWSLDCFLSHHLWCIPCLEQPDRSVDVSETSSASTWSSSGLTRPYSQRSSSLRGAERMWVFLWHWGKRNVGFTVEKWPLSVWLTSVLLGLSVVLLFVLLLCSWRLRHVLLNGLIWLPGLQEETHMRFTQIKLIWDCFTLLASRNRHLYLCVNLELRL